MRSGHRPTPGRDRGARGGLLRLPGRVPSSAVRQWRDVYMDYRQFKAMQIQARLFKVPFGLEENTSATDLDFIYRSRISSRLAPGRDAAFAVHGRVLKGFVSYEGGRVSPRRRQRAALRTAPACLGDDDGAAGGRVSVPGARSRLGELELAAR